MRAISPATGLGRPKGSTEGKVEFGDFPRRVVWEALFTEGEKDVSVQAALATRANRAKRTVAVTTVADLRVELGHRLAQDIRGVSERRFFVGRQRDLDRPLDAARWRVSVLRHQAGAGLAVPRVSDSAP